MIVYHGIDSVRERSARARIAALGMFDGVHLGHQHLLNEVRAWAGSTADSAIVTFDRHPLETLTKSPPVQVLSLEHKLRLLEQYGVEVTLVLHFDEQLSRWSAAEFAERVFVEALGSIGLLMGFDTAFGHRREGDYPRMQDLASELKLEVRRAGVAELDGVRVSSTLVREAIGQGDLPRLRALLGRRFSVLGRVVRGDGRGRQLGYPTVNLDVRGAVLPPAGVYFAEASLGNARPAGEVRYPAVVNIGNRPTFSNDGTTEPGSATVEAHLLDFDGDLYGREVELHFDERHRGEKKFPSAAALAEQIAADIREYRSRSSTP